MKPKLYLALSACFLLFFAANTSLKAQTNCCPLPDSLSVTSVTDSTFCIRWRIMDTIGCDTPYGAILAYRPIGAPNWTTKKIKYTSYPTFYTYCDTLTGCVRYQWKLRNVCISGGDTTFTEYVKGPNFDAGCDLLFAKSTSLNERNTVQVFPNPVRNAITLKGTFEGVSKVKVVITDLHGNVRLQREISVVKGVLNASFDASAWNKGAYFVTVSDGKKTIKQNFLKE